MAKSYLSKLLIELELQAWVTNLIYLFEQNGGKTNVANFVN